MIRNGKRTVWSDTAALGIERRRALTEQMGWWAATLADALEESGGSYTDPGVKACVDRLAKLGGEWNAILYGLTGLWDAQRCADRLTDPDTVPHVSTVYGRSAGAPMVDPAHAQLAVQRRYFDAGERRSRVVELADVAFGMVPAPATSDVPF